MFYFAAIRLAWEQTLLFWVIEPEAGATSAPEEWGEEMCYTLCRARVFAVKVKRVISELRVHIFQRFVSATCNYFEF